MEKMFVELINEKKWNIFFVEDWYKVINKHKKDKGNIWSAGE